MEQQGGAGFLERWRAQVDERLAQELSAIGQRAGCPADLLAAMRHALLAGGKRLRPLLSLAALSACRGRPADGLSVACALEFVHAYSLVHDDLPPMDDDDLRRGQPTCHRAFGEALAILAGDALLTHAFGLLAGGVPGPRAAEAVRLLAEAAGASGMVGGQADDVRASDGRQPTVEEVEAIHRRKTGCLIEASVRLGALCAGASEPQAVALEEFGRALGLAFQIADDLLAQHGAADVLGRPTGSDRSRDRRTHPRAAGVAASRGRALDLLDSALTALAPLGESADALRELAETVRARCG